MDQRGFMIEVIDDVIYWTNTTGDITEKDALSISHQIRSLVELGNIEAVIVDNRRLFGVWSPEVDKVWIDLMAYLPRYVERTATLCQNVINKLQLNYLSAQAGTEDHVQAFTENEEPQMAHFLKLDDVFLFPPRKDINDHILK